MYIDERGFTVTEEDLKSDWAALSDEEQQEYGFCFGKYKSACMFWNGGTLKPIK